MKKHIMIASLFLCGNTLALDQTAIIEGSGQKVILHENRTWDVAPSEDSPPPMVLNKATDAVEVVDSSIGVEEVNYINVISLTTKYRNKSDRKITGISFRVTITNSFGKKLLETKLDDEISLSAGATGGSDGSWQWKDNPYIQNEPYDLMWPSVNNGTATVKIEPIKVVFSDGLILPRPQKKK